MPEDRVTLALDVLTGARSEYEYAGQGRPTANGVYRCGTGEIMKATFC